MSNPDRLLVRALQYACRARRLYSMPAARNESLQKAAQCVADYDREEREGDFLYEVEAELPEFWHH